MPAAADQPAPKLLGSDTELGNFIQGLVREQGTGELASRALLNEIHGLPFHNRPGSLAELVASLSQPVSNAQDFGRKFLPANGSSVYIDLSHLELCTPEVLGARAFATAFHGMLRLARRGLADANARLPDHLKIVAIVNNSDGQDNSYGSHMNFLMKREAWTRLFHRRLQDLLALASFQVSSIIITGQGKVGPEDRARIRENGYYEISQRASFFECLSGSQTTYNRPLVNSRDEALCGRYRESGCPADRFARLHSIFFDATLAYPSIFLRAGIMQVILCQLEAGVLDTSFILDDPVGTVGRWSRDPLLATRALLLSGKEVTALELQQRFLEQAAAFVARGGCGEAVPDADDIIQLWSDTLDKFQRQDFAALSSRLDWVLKLSLLERAMQHQPGLTWSSPEIKHLDFKYADLEEGLFWACDQAGAVERVGVTEEDVRKFMREPPENTRAWTRAQLLRLAPPGSVEDLDWDKITFKLRTQHGSEYKRTVALPNPLGFTRRDTESVFRRAEGLGEVLDLLGAPQRDPVPLYSAGSSWSPSNSVALGPRHHPPSGGYYYSGGNNQSNL